MIRTLALAAACVAVIGCSGMVTAVDGDRVTIEHDGFVSAESAREIAIRSCRQSGKADAKYVKSTNKNPRLDAGFGVQLSTFQCQ
mgnify:FL=1